MDPHPGLLGVDEQGILAGLCRLQQALAPKVALDEDLADSPAQRMGEEVLESDGPEWPLRIVPFLVEEDRPGIADGVPEQGDDRRPARPQVHGVGRGEDAEVAALTGLGLGLLGTPPIRRPSHFGHPGCDGLRLAAPSP